MPGPLTSASASVLRTFPRPERGGAEGLVQVGGPITVDRLLEAYTFGIFPWPSDGYSLLWFSPDPRGVLDFEHLHVPRSLAKWLRSPSIRFSWNECFDVVIDACGRAPRPGQAGSWITPEIKKAYSAFHRAGHAHSLECWRDEKLIGGLYGVFVAGVFCGESMFYLESNASKACVVHLVVYLKSLGLTWMDTQMVTPTIAQLGGREIPRSDFLARLGAAR